MTRLARHLLVLLLAIALPISAWAGMVMPLPVQPCPMMAQWLATADVDKPACCADAAAMAKTGSPCKMGQDCKTSNPAQGFATMTFDPVQYASPQASYTVQHQLNANPTGVWRPPRLI